MDHPDNFSGGNESQVIGNKRKGNPCYKVTKNMAELCLCFIKGRTFTFLEEII